MQEFESTWKHSLSTWRCLHTYHWLMIPKFLCRTSSFMIPPCLRGSWFLHCTWGYAFYNITEDHRPSPLIVTSSWSLGPWFQHIWFYTVRPCLHINNKIVSVKWLLRRNNLENFVCIYICTNFAFWQNGPLLLVLLKKILKNFSCPSYLKLQTKYLILRSCLGREKWIYITRGCLHTNLILYPCVPP